MNYYENEKDDIIRPKKKKQIKVIKPKADHKHNWVVSQYETTNWKGAIVSVDITKCLICGKEK